MTDRLFKFGSVEDEIMKSMETTLVKYQKDQMYGHEKLAKAVDHLNAAAEIFDNTGFNKEAEFITKLIEKIANHGVSNVGDLIEKTLPHHRKSPVDKVVEEELNKQDIEDLINARDPYKNEFEEMMSGLHADPLEDLKAYKKKV